MNYTEIISTIILLIGVLAFCVSVITQVFKGVGFLSKIPTDGLVFILSIILTVTAFVAYMQHTGHAILWYMIIAAVILGFFVAFVSMYGWEKFSSLLDRYKFKNEMFLDDLDMEDEEEYTPGAKR